jgi:glycosyltransferase involved in cell wall biosynthesis
MAAGANVRILGVALPDVSDWDQPHPGGKWSQFFAALANRGSLTDVVRPRLSSLEEYVNLARSIRPRRATWLAHAGFNRRHLAKVNTALERELVRRAGSYDVIVQLQTLCSPRSGSVSEPYAIYTDNTMALSQRHYPGFAPVSASASREWMNFEADVCRGAVAVFTLSEFARRSVVEDYECPPDRVLAVGAGANHLSCTPGGSRPDKPRALFVGNDFERKGGVTLLEAWRLVRRAVPAAELRIAGPRRDPAPGFGAGVRWLGRLDRAALAE